MTASSRYDGSVGFRQSKLRAIHSIREAANQLFRQRTNDAFARAVLVCLVRTDTSHAAYEEHHVENPRVQEHEEDSRRSSSWSHSPLAMSPSRRNTNNDDLSAIAEMVLESGATLVSLGPVTLLCLLWLLWLLWLRTLLPLLVLLHFLLLLLLH